MQSRSNRLKFYGGFLVLLLGSLTLYLQSIVGGPDFDLHFSREVPSILPAQVIQQSVFSLVNWPRWFHALVDAKAINIAGMEYPAKDQYLSAGTIVRLSVDAKKGKWKKFELTLQILEYVPGQKVRMKVLHDSKGRLTTLFDSLEWQVAWGATPTGTWVRGEAHAHTSHWRSRLFGKIAERILMNQVFYPDLIKLVELRDPRSHRPAPGVGAGQ